MVTRSNREDITIICSREYKIFRVDIEREVDKTILQTLKIDAVDGFDLLRQISERAERIINLFIDLGRGSC
ncbi:hypothetical protein Tco_1352018 [Tanacetum coccineum]